MTSHLSCALLPAVAPARAGPRGLEGRGRGQEASEAGGRIAAHILPAGNLSTSGAASKPGLFTSEPGGGLESAGVCARVCRCLYVCVHRTGQRDGGHTEDGSAPQPDDPSARVEQTQTQPSALAVQASPPSAALLSAQRS